jgi:hypothetical protein
MRSQQSFTLPGAWLVRRTILSVLIGLMGGGSRVYAQQPPDAGSAVASSASPAADVAPMAASQSAPAEMPPGAPPAAPAEAPAVAAKPDPPPAAATDSTTPAAPADASPATPDTKPEPAAAPPAKPVSVAVGKNGKPLAPKAAAKGKKVKKEKPPKLTPVSIVQGTLTVDGWTGKARLNYDIADLKYIYMYAPGVGTVVVSDVKFPLGKEVQNAFNGNTLTIDANGHTVQLFSEKKLLKSKKPVSAWVYVDTGYQLPSAYPVMGYGITIQAPYAWPGAKNVKVAKSGTIVPPPLPKDLRPVLATAPCIPAGSKAIGTPCPAVPVVAPVTTTNTAAAPGATSMPAAQTP